MYASANDHDQRKSRTFTSLYAACRDILDEHNGIVIQTGYRAAFRGNRVIAFWCSHENRVKPTRNAYDHERAAILDYHLTS